MKSNIVIIGDVQDGYPVDHVMSIKEVMNHLNVVSLAKNYRDEYFKYLQREIKEWLGYSDVKDSILKYKTLLGFLDEYLSNPNGEFNEQAFDSAVLEIEDNDFNKQLLSNRLNQLSINSGTTLIHAPGHICNKATALIVPLLLSCMKHLENAILICNSDFLFDCDKVNHYRMSNRFVRNIQYECIRHNILFIEYTGNNWINF